MLPRNNIVFLLCFGASLVAIAHIGGEFFEAGSQTWWRIANVLHFLGGVFAFFFIRAIFLYTKSHHRLSAAWWMELWIYVLGAVAMGVVWEWYEFFLDRYRVLILGNASEMTYFDTIGDLALDTLGAMAAASFIWFYGTKK